MELGIPGYAAIRLLGSGQFGDVYLVRRQRDGKEFAAKQSHGSGVISSGEIQEAHVMQKLRHPNIIKYEELIQLHGRQPCAIIMEYAGGGDLAEFIKAYKQRNEPVPEEEIMRLFIQVTSAMLYLHDQRLLHRDLKPQNILLDSRGIAKLSDFGVARSLHHTFDAAQTLTGTPYYMAPEILDNLPYDSKADIWSLGCVVYELARLSPPFQAPSFAALVLQITNHDPQPLPPMYSAGIRALISNMLEKDPLKRPDARRMLEMPFVQQWLLHIASSAPSSAMLQAPVPRQYEQMKGIEDAVGRSRSREGIQQPVQVADALREPESVNSNEQDAARRIFFENQAAARRNKGRVELEKAAPAPFLDLDLPPTREQPLRNQLQAAATRGDTAELKEKMRACYLENARAARENRQRALEEQAEQPHHHPQPPGSLSVSPPGPPPPPPPAPIKPESRNYEALLEEERRRVRMERKLLQERMRSLQEPGSDTSVSLE